MGKNFISYQFGMHQLLQVAFFANFNVIMHDEDNSACPLKEFALSSVSELGGEDALFPCVQHQWWVFCKQATSRRVIS